MHKSSLVFLVTSENVLLGLKKQGISKGKWCAIGGGLEISDASIYSSAVREFKEETNLEVHNLKKAGIVRVSRPDRFQKIYVFISENWSGELRETDEMDARWFHFSEVPYGQMWEDSRIWFPQILIGRRISVDVVFDKKMRLKMCCVNFLKNFPSKGDRL